MQTPKCCKCGKVMALQFHLVVHLENETFTHKGHECVECDMVDPVRACSSPKVTPWDGVAHFVEIAKDVGKKIGKAGDYYKPAHFGFSWWDDEVRAILTFLTGEPEVTPEWDGFGLVESEVTIEQEEGEEVEG